MAVNLKKLPNGLILLIIFLLPLLSASRFYGFEEIKVLFFLIFTTIAALLWVLTKPKIRWDKIKISQSAFLCVLFLTSLTGINPMNSLLGNPPYFQGWIVYVYFFIFSLMVSDLDIGLNTYAKVLTGSGFIVALLADYQWVLKNIFHFYVPTYADRVVSTFGQPNFYAGFLILVIGMNYFLLKQAKQRILFFIYLVFFLTSVLAILASGSRTVIILMVFMFLIWLISKISRFKLVLTTFFLIIIILAIIVSKQVGAGIFNKEMFNLSLSDNPDLTNQSVEKRPYIWMTAFDVYSQYPFAGVGLENIGTGYSKYFQENKHKIFEENLKISPVLISLKDLYIDRTHNYILDILLFSGVEGVVTWTMLVVLSAHKTLTLEVSTFNSVLLMELLTYLMWIQFQNQSIVHLFIFWFLLGLISNKKQGIDSSVRK